MFFIMPDDPYVRPEIHKDVVQSLDITAKNAASNMPDHLVEDMSIEEKIEIVIEAYEESYRELVNMQEEKEEED